MGGWLVRGQVKCILHPHTRTNNTITSEAQLQQILLSIENKMPDLAGWFAPHLLLARLSLLLVLVAALAFKRSRETFS